MTKKKVCPSTLTNEFVNKKNTRDHESEVTKGKVNLLIINIINIVKTISNHFKNWKPYDSSKTRDLTCWRWYGFALVFSVMTLFCQIVFFALL